MVGIRRVAKTLAALSLLLLANGPAASKSTPLSCSSDAIHALVAKLAPAYQVAPPRITNHTLVVELHVEKESWRAILTLNYAEDTVYTSIGGEKLTPEVRPRLQGLVEKAAADPEIRALLKRCANTTVEKAKKASTDALQQKLDQQKKAAPPPSQEEQNAAFYITTVLPTLWGALIFFAFLALWRRRRFSLNDAGIVGSLILVGLVLRVFVPPWGPGDISNTTSGVQGGAENLLDFGHYGRGIEGLLILVEPLLGSGEDTLVGLNLLFGLLTIPLIHAFVRRLGYNQAVAHASALFLTVAPLHIRFSPTYNRYIALIFLLVLGWTMLLAYLSQRKSTDLALAFCALALGIQCRPEAAVVPFASLGLVLVVLACPEGRERVHAIKWWLIASWVVLVATVLLPVSSVLETAGDHQRWVEEYVDKGRPLFDPNYNAFLSPWLSAVLWVPLALWGLLRPPNGNRWVVAWVAAMALGFSAIVGTRHLGDSHVIDARYHLSALPFYLILSAAGTVALGQWLATRYPSAKGWLPQGVLLGIAATAFVAMPSASMRTTMNQEYDFLREHLSDVPDGCTIVAFEPDYDLGLRAPFHLSANLGLTHRWKLEREYVKGTDAEATCVAYYHTASCTTLTDIEDDQRGQTGMCRQLRNNNAGTIASTSLSAIPAGAYIYQDDPVEVGLYWLKRP